MTDSIALPAPPAAVDPPPFPMVGALAPLVVAAILFAATRSSAVLLFAVFSPVLAVAAVVDGRLQMRRRLRRGTERHEAALDQAERELAALTAARSANARRGHPDAAALVAAPTSWVGLAPSNSVVIGFADQSGPALMTGTPTTDRERALIARGRLVHDAPVTVAPDATIAVVGPAAFAAPIARGIAVQRGRAAARPTLPAVAARVDDLPAAGVDVVLAVESFGVVRIQHAHGRAAALAGLVVRAPSVTRASLAAVEQALGVRADGQTTLAALLQHPAPAVGLSARFAVGGQGPIDLDLVADGPHAVVGGTTGSGKSALLTAWVLALAAAHPPADLALLLVDCKGGAAFDAVRGLPQVTGFVTDLDGGGVERAVASLRAEIRRREQEVRDAGAADVTGTTLPRLVVVVDEFRALLDAHPDLGAVFVDVAARGRSLGMHLILCTQRPAGSVRDELLTNCAVRIALRVNDAADSVAIVGSDAAWRIPKDPAGGAMLLVPGEPPRSIRVGRIEDGVVAAAVGWLTETAPAGRPRRVWLDPLPDRLPLAAIPAPDVTDGALVLGLVDRPDLQAQPVLEWNPRRHPRLLVLGDAGSGRTTALALVAIQLRTVWSSTAVLSADPATAWDQLRRDDVPLVIDGLERLLDLLGPSHAQAALDRLAERLRNSSAAPTVLALRGPAGWGGVPLRPLLGLFDDRILLRLTLDDHVALGGDRASSRVALPAGGGWWQGHRVQFALSDQPLDQGLPSVPAALTVAAGPLIVVSVRPEQRGAELVAAGFAVGNVADSEAWIHGVGSSSAVVPAFVGSPDAWQSRWSTFAKVRGTALLVVDSLSAAEFRALAARNSVAPPVSDPRDVVVVPQEGEPQRRRIAALADGNPA